MAISVLSLDLDDESEPYAEAYDASGKNESVSKTSRNIDFFRPIPLTEEWLLKFGFEVDDHLMNPDDWPYVDYIKNEVRISEPNYSFAFYGRDNELEIKYVHQLQNLYFALTGEELCVIQP
jgi:hypothetical protein